MSDPFDDIIETLRQPATSSELAHRDRDIAAMSKVASAPTVVPIRGRFGRPARLATFVAAGVIGFGGVAAAGPGVFDDSLSDVIVEHLETLEAGGEGDVEGDEQSSTTTAPETTTPETTAPETTAPETTVPPTTVPEEPVPVTTGVDAPTTTVEGESVLVDDPETDFDETQCAEGNHGKTVSSVARTEGRTGQDVSEAAKSSCGKDRDGDDDDTDDDDTDDDDTDDSDDDDDDADDSDDDDIDNDNEAEDGEGREGNGKGNNGNGRGNAPEAPTVTTEAPAPPAEPEPTQDETSGNGKAGNGNGGNGKGGKKDK